MVEKTSETEVIINKLLDYEKEGFVFHGSEYKMDTIQPKVAQDVRGDEVPFNNSNAIFAAQYAVAAVIFAVVGKEDLPNGTWSVGEDRKTGEIVVEFPSEWKAYLQNRKGYVYVLESQNFNESDAWQVKSIKAVEPTDVIEVDIEIFYEMGGKIIWT